MFMFLKDCYEKTVYWCKIHLFKHKPLKWKSAKEIENEQAQFHEKMRRVRRLKKND